MRIIYSIILLFVVGAFGSGCDIINPAEKTPTYVRIDSFAFEDANPSKTGSISNDISAVWVYLDSKPIGVFDVPSTFPVLLDRDSRLSIAPGVTYSGLKNYKALYPFYAFDTMTLKVDPGNVVTFNAKTKYVDGLNFIFKEDFEVGNKFDRLVPEEPLDTAMVRTADKDKVYEGGGSGYIYLDKAHTSSQMFNNTDIKIPIGESYLELDFKSSVQFEIGLYATLKSGSAAFQYFQGVYPNSNWTKLYVPLEAYTNTFQGVSYRLLIKATLPDGQKDGYVLLDNLKIVTY
ncbi:MAG: hypothetical protein R2800_14260 [Flavipsychrobacter sp.]